MGVAGALAYAGVAWAATSVILTRPTSAGAAGELACGAGCLCRLDESEAEFRVLCTGSANQTASLTEAVFDGPLSASAYKTYVRVASAPTLVVTGGFVRHWRRFHSCVLDVWSVPDLRLPRLQEDPLLQEEEGEAAPWEHVFAGVGLVDVGAAALPGGLFAGKERAFLGLTRSSVGAVLPGLFAGVGSFGALRLLGSSVGVFGGPSGGGAGGRGPLQASSEDPITVEGSLIGRLERGAFRLRAEEAGPTFNVLLRESVFGEVSSGAVELSGPFRLLLDRCRVGLLAVGGLGLSGGASLALEASALLAEEAALALLPCPEEGALASRVLCVAGPQNRSTSASSFCGGPEAVLKPSCVAADPVRPEQTLVYVFASSTVLVSCLLVLLLLLLRRRSSRPQRGPSVLMSGLQDSIYEEIASLRPNFPASPPPAPPSCCQDGGGGLCSDSRPGLRPGPKAAENDYMAMR